MTRKPLVSVITPTWKRHDLLFGRCIPSVLAQTWRPLQHVIVSDGPDPELAAEFATRFPGGEADGVDMAFYQLPAHDPAVRWGVRARLCAADLAWGDYHAWLDDDNAFRADHVETLVNLLEDHPEAGFAYSRAAFWRSDSEMYLVGAPAPCYGGIDTSIMFNRAALLRVATWRDEGQSTIDWDLVERWLAAGVAWAHEPRTTCDYYMAGAAPPAGITVREVERP